VGKKRQAAYTLNIEVLKASETFEVMYKSAWHHIPEDLRFHAESVSFSDRNRFFFSYSQKKKKNQPKLYFE
jgi:hypothetical protein